MSDVKVLTQDPSTRTVEVTCERCLGVYNEREWLDTGYPHMWIPYVLPRICEHCHLSPTLTWEERHPGTNPKTLGEAWGIMLDSVLMKHMLSFDKKMGYAKEGGADV